ncbi:GNAT family N-acetyltransferase [Neobacillus muris]|uniref:GNAT family N-acetyltransferase n=1 Tax=Neobacillus muris TaxID=2941334 RepID=UPI00203C3439|nr:GNAT family N-acetyltransferase [Neobacillus muris]
MEAIIHRDINCLEKIIPEWDILKNEFYEVTVFQDVGWFKSWWNYKSKKMEITPYIIEIKDQNKTVGVVPFYIFRTRLAKIIFRTLKPIGSELSDYILPIISKNYQTDEILNVAFNKLYRDKSSWDRIEWGDIPEYSFFANFIRKQKQSRSSLIKGERTDVCPYLPLSSDFEELKNKFNKRFLKEILYKERKLNSEGKLVFRRVSKEQEIEPILNKFFDLHCERWSYTDTPSKFRFEEEKEQVLEAAKNLFENNSLYLAYISHDNEIVVVHIGMTDGKRSYLYLHAMNIHYRKYSPGSLLAYYLIQDACKEGYEAVDFLRGDEGYKENWATQERFNVKFDFYNHSLKSMLYKNLIEAYQHKHFSLLMHKINSILESFKKVSTKLIG